MPRALLIALVILAFGCGPSPAPTEMPAAATASASQAPSAAAPERPTARGLAITVEIPKRRWLIGENILAHYVVKNVSNDPVPVSFGGDYRGSSRARRFIVVATNAAGEEVADPDPNPNHFGGLGMEKKLAPGDELAFTLQLMRYCRFEAAGTYRVRVAHDLGWGGAEKRPPPEDQRWAEAQIELALPTPAEARAVVDAMGAMKETGGYSWGERAPPFADFSAMRLPIYVPLLDERLDKTGDLRVLEGIAANATPAATGALIRLSEHSRSDVAEGALGHLLRRLPRAQLPGEGRFEDPARDHLIENSWRPSFAPTVTALAKRLLATKLPKKQIAAAHLLDASGTAADLGVVLDAGDEALKKSKSETLTFPRPESAPEALVRTARVLVSRGAKVPPSPVRPAEVALYIAHWQVASPRPPDYDKRLGSWLSHDIPMVRFFALRALSLPFDKRVIGQLPVALKSSHPAESVKACDAMAKSKDARFRKPIAARIASARDEWLIRCLGPAAIAVGMPRDEVARAWVARLGDVEVTMEAFGELRAFIEHEGGSGMSGKPDAAEAKRLKARWSRFVKEHAAALRAGKRFSIGDAALTTDLIPKGFVFHRPGAPDWP